MVSATDGDFETWSLELQPILASLMAETNILHDAYLRRAGSLIASSDQLRTISRQLMNWTPGHPCPTADVDIILSKMSRSVEWLSELLESESHSSFGPDYPLIEQEINGLYNFLADLWVAMQRESGR